ncbi:MAG: hypothetical protein M1508_13110 [Nitrospirae bacterium]|nr:hypothetical protein [Nitrospirota bacterium]
MLTYQAENSIGQRISALVLGPMVGLVYVICLPFMAIATIITLLAEKVMGGVLGLLWSLVSFGWRPSEAYLSGKKRKKKGNR